MATDPRWSVPKRSSTAMLVFSGAFRRNTSTSPAGASVPLWVPGVMRVAVAIVLPWSSVVVVFPPPARSRLLSTERTRKRTTTPATTTTVRRLLHQEARVGDAVDTEREG